MSEERYLLLLKVLQGNPKQDIKVQTFAIQTKKFIYSNGNKCKPTLSLGRINVDNEEAIFRVNESLKKSCSLKEVIHSQKARDIIQRIHQPDEKVCHPLGITKLMHILNQRYTINECQKLN